MKQIKGKNLGKRVNEVLYNNTSPSLRHFNIASVILNISPICAQRSGNIYKGYIKESKYKIEHPKMDNLNKIDKYILNDDYITLEGTLSELSDQIKQLLKE